MEQLGAGAARVLGSPPKAVRPRRPANCRNTATSPTWDNPADDGQAMFYKLRSS
jgi:hypothetical protein